ncbi:MAG: TRAP transporter large permease subunit [Proteobacteria bacterium]|nr:TRAP transporter large permease subunit [Pseudomonadota bacterium]MBU1712343.1 TRAP transporter large permease subunit [Pseudomonadota bacterium]
MTTEWIGIISVILLFLLLCFGIPVGVSLGLIGFFGLFLTSSLETAFAVVQTLPYSVVGNYSWAVLPLFVFMGTIAGSCGMTDDLFNVAKIWLGRLRGGLYLTVTWGSAAFGAVSGSTVVNAVVFTRLALPQMLQQGYSKSLSIGCIASAGTFAAMIPPSLTMVIYCMITEVSLGRLMIAGIIPGLLTAINYSLFILIFVRLKPSLAPKLALEDYSMKEKLASLGRAWGIVIIIILVFGGIWGGFFAPSAAGAIGAFGVFIIALFKLGLKGNWIIEGLKSSAAVACIIFTILIGGLLFSRFLALQGVISQCVEFITSSITSGLGLIVFFTLLYLVLGCLIDTASIMVITLPFLFPLVQGYQIDPILFGILFVKMIEISTLTPPVGLNLFAAVSAAGKDVSMKQGTKGVLPFLGVEALTMVELIMFPQLSLWLPNTMMGQ